ncbi:MAG: T9SS type A sorting domain-containing protein [Bacteroidota bacterium]
MKKLITAAILMGISLLTFGQTLPNSDFQSWVTEGIYENPVSWSTSNNPILSLLGAIPVSKSTDSYTGDYSARLETKDIPTLGLHVPGIVTLADINIVVEPPSYSISGGFALQENVSRLTGMYKYSGTNDSATVIIYNFKHNTGSEFDTIGFGITTLNNASTWTEFSVDMQSLNYHVPDTFNVIVMSSSSPDFTSGGGSVLYVDDLKIETNTGIINLSSNKLKVNVYPNPSSDYVQFETSEIGNDRLLSIYDVTGRIIVTHEFNANKIQVNIKDLHTGMYTFRVTDENNILNSGSFIKN